ncbi:MAG: transglutaminase domain-containing protein [Ignavibacteria bacterium]|nr:transglutaminase domain-containing protein [Ignavibacteria bacterium]
MKKTILLIFAALLICTLSVSAQFTKGQIDELTAMGISAAIEPENAAVRNKANELTEAYRNKDFIQNVCAIFDNVFRNWNYQRDPGGMEYFEKAGVSVYTYTGDCDDYATLMISLIKSLGGDGRVVCVSGHAYPELYLGRNITDDEIQSIQDSINEYYESKGSRTRANFLNYHTDTNGKVWLNLDYQERYPGGRFAEYSRDAEHLVIYPDGSYELAYLNK